MPTDNAQKQALDEVRRLTIERAEQLQKQEEHREQRNQVPAKFRHLIGKKIPGRKPDISGK